MLKKEALNTLIVALVLCLVCSIAVSTIAVALKPVQTQNKLLDRNKNILSAAGLLDEGATDKEISEIFSSFELKMVNLETNKFATEAELEEAGIDPVRYNQRRAAKSPSAIKYEGAPSGLTSVARFAPVYILRENGNIKLLVLPVRGPGLWGTLYGFLVLEGDLNTIRGLSFYEHKETPGLGAKVDTDKWKSQWPGKKAYTANHDINIVVGSKNGNPAQPGFIDGLSGATLTTVGVHKTMQFWLSEKGYKTFLSNLEAGEA